MAEYSKLYITNNGQALMAKMIAGSGNIDFTKVCSSSTQYTESQLQALTALSNIKQTTLVSKVTRTNEVAIKIDVTKLGANWNNGLNTSAFYWNLNNASSNRNRNISGHLVNAIKNKNVVKLLALPHGKI